MTHFLHLALGRNLMVGLFAFIGLVALSAASAAAQSQTVSPVQGCTAVATVYKTNCNTTLIQQCEDGLFRSDHYINGTLTSAHWHDADWGLVRFESAARNEPAFELVAGSGASHSLSALITDGAGPASGTYEMVLPRFRVPFTLSGQAALTGETVTLNGISLLAGTTRRVFSPTNGAESVVFDIDFLISEEHNLFIEGHLKRSGFDLPDLVFDETPTALFLPGQPGFGRMSPETGCGE